jgi:hypothetical protein
MGFKPGHRISQHYNLILRLAGPALACLEGIGVLELWHECEYVLLGYSQERHTHLLPSGILQAGFRPETR